MELTMASRLIDLWLERRRKPKVIADYVWSSVREGRFYFNGLGEAEDSLLFKWLIVVNL